MNGALLAAAGAGLAASLLLAVLAWVVSLRRHDVTVVDIAWGWVVVAPALAAAALLPWGPRAAAVLVVALAWAARLSLFIGWRHRGQPEDRRYQAIRARNEPHFEYKSLYLVFGLQAVLGWIVAAPLVATVASPAPWGWLDSAGLVLALAGLVLETVGDAQLAHFRAGPSRRGQVMDRGLWRYTRHPNYFGEFCMWWGFGAMSLAAGAWWALVSPVLMTVLLLRVSGVTLLEKDLRERRPAYRDYQRRTNAFFPGRPRA